MAWSPGEVRSQPFDGGGVLPAGRGVASQFLSLEESARAAPPKPDRRSSHGPRKRDKVRPFVALSVSSLAIAEIEFRNGVRVRIPARDAEALRIVLRTGSDVCQEVR